MLKAEIGGRHWSARRRETRRPRVERGQDEFFVVAGIRDGSLACHLLRHGAVAVGPPSFFSLSATFSVIRSAVFLRTL